MARAIYLYCVVRSARKPRAATVPPGLPGAERPAPVPLDDGLWLVTASVPLEKYGTQALESSLSDLDWVAATAVAHEAVVEFFAHAPGATVIPMKLFTMFSTDGRATSEMRKRRRELDRVFDRIEGCEEWGVRVTRGQRRTSGRASRPASGTSFLRARKKVRDDSRQAVLATVEAAETAFASLSEIAREGRRRTDEVPGGVAPVLDAAFLVPSRRRARFHAAVERFSKHVASAGGRMTMTGPWPPYNFVSPSGERA